ncbi:MAG: hypothetical protein KDE63_10920 [Novosphingobium sp.]|nr:hypothetical protein [Novosphingobium sp.]
MLDWHLYRDSFSTLGMRQIWSEEATISAWIKVEQTLARSQAEVGLIPSEAAAKIESLSASDLDAAALLEEMKLVGRPIVGLVKQLRSLVGADFAAYVHYRASTQDIMDTALAMQMQQGLREVYAMLAQIAGHLQCHIAAHPDTMMIGRTNGQHALPILLKTKLEVWREELARRNAALVDAAGRGLMVQIGGPVGDLRKYEGETGQLVKTCVADALNLGSADPHWQNARDGVAEIVTACGALCASLCKIAHNVNLLCSSDIGEFLEGYGDRKGASSSMTHKRNQRASEFGEAVARLGRQRSEQIGEVTLHQHERAGGVWITEWMIVPEVFLLTSGALMWAEQMFATLNMRGDIMAQKIALAETDISNH